MPGPDFPEYSTVYCKEARALRDALPQTLRSALDVIEDGLADNPDAYPRRTVQLSEDIFVYRHPNPRIEVTYRIDREKKVIYLLHLVAPTLEVSKPLFISYSHADEEWLLELRKWLKPLEQNDLISIWDDTELKAGDDWRGKIKEALTSAKAALLLISQNFLASDFIANNELPPLLEKAKDEGLRILWVAVSSSTVDDTDIVKYQAVLKEPPLDSLEPPQRNKEFLRIYETIKEAVQH